MLEEQVESCLVAFEIREPYSISQKCFLCHVGMMCSWFYIDTDEPMEIHHVIVYQVSETFLRPIGGSSADRQESPGAYH